MKITIRKKESSHSFATAENESLLVAGLRQGLALGYECATGTCGTCRAKLVSGELEQGWLDAPGRQKLKTEQGEFLMCQARALTDCELKTPGKLELLASSVIRPSRIEGRIAAVRQLTHDVNAFDINLSSPMNFQAGQFVTIETPVVSGARAYSMVNSEGATDRLEFVVKRFPNGGFSDWMFDADAQGAHVSVVGPLGGAIYEPALEKDILCIAGGSGIAGMMSIIGSGCRDGYFEQHRAQLYFGVRTSSDVFYLDELLVFAEQFPQTLSVTIALSESMDKVSFLKQLPNVHYTDGFVHLAARQSDLAVENSLAYIAGPPPMVDGALRDLIAESGYSPAQIRYDKFA